ncbi:MAG TPA: hypothetical protein DEG71_00050 [Clostridiales bacterium]|nr:hypothetical protein [Clostridiales bacterium]
MNEKEWLEKSLISYFIKAINNMHNTNYSITIHRDRPDFIIGDTLQNKNFGVEITHLFYDEEEAKELLGHVPMINSKVENIEHYINILNKLLNKKAHKAKAYDHSHELVLLVGITSPLFTWGDFENSREYIVIPQNDFSIICLVFFNEEHQNWEDLMFIKQECPICDINIV